MDTHTLYRSVYKLPKQLKSIEALKGNGTVNISALTEQSFKDFPKELWGLTEEHSITKIHNHQLVHSLSEIKVPFFFFPMPYRMFQEKKKKSSMDKTV